MNRIILLIILSLNASIVEAYFPIYKVYNLDTSVIDLGLCLIDVEDSTEITIEMDNKNGLYYFHHSLNFHYHINLLDTTLVQDKCHFKYKVYFNRKYRVGLHSDSIFFNFFIGKKKCYRKLIIFKSNVVKVRQSNLESLMITDNNIPSVIFDSMHIQLDTLQEGQPMIVNLRLRNLDTLPVILKVERICSCESPEWTQSPINPGQYGYVKLQRDTNGKAGQNARKLDIKANGFSFNVEIRYYVKPKN